DVLKANVDIAKKKYAEFFKDHVLPNLPDAREALDKLIEAAAGGLSEQEKQGVGSFIPIVDAKLLTSGGAVFGDFNIDLDSLRDAARRDFYYKDGDGLSRLFDPALEAMAKNTFGDDADKTKERAQFKADVMARLEPLLDKIAAGEVGLGDLAGNVERLVAGLSHPTGGDVWGYRHAVATALDGLVHAANFVSKMPANPDWNMERGIRGGTAPKSHLHTHSVNDVMTMISLATGLAGQGIASGGGDSRFFLGSAGEAGIAKKMFGTENKGWSKTLARLQLDYMDKSLLDESLSKTSKLVTEQVRKELPRASVIAPVSVTTEGLKKMLAPSLNALAETLFKDNAEAAEQYKTNITTIYTALWGLLRPGGNADTLVTQVRQLVDKTVTSAPSGVDQLKYKESVVQGVMSILQATRAIYNDRNATNQNWDTIGITVLHSMAGLSAIGKALGSALIADMPSTLPPLLVGEDFPISAREQLGKFFKGTGIAIGSLAAIGWMPVEYFQLLKAYKDGNSDAGDLAFMTVGVVADTIGAAEATFGLAELLINSAFVGRTGAQVTMLPLAFSTGFTVASIVSWLAWAGLVAYQTAKQQKETDKFVDRMNDDLQRLIGIKADIYNF
ncbi:MAG TPA: hypothetical protein VD840_03965, partial [Sinorhizobium sp.]|nr:hypothetical protein [Sinorhizobium sp.]